MGCAASSSHPLLDGRGIVLGGRARGPGAGGVAQCLGVWSMQTFTGHVLNMKSDKKVQFMILTVKC